MNTYKAFLVAVCCCTAVLGVTGTENSNKALRWTFQNSFYELVTDTELGWAQAKNECRRKGMWLVSFESDEEYYTVLEFIKPLKMIFWTSGSDDGHDGEFYWEATGKSIGSFTSWLPGEPTIGTDLEHCLQMADYNEFLWSNEDCNKTANYICEGEVCP
ncbi:lectin subunit alpha-like [Cloeon dipterum]|uniref:lectin subunit alpha-like n=1 Tax=Cloeon dipterum TaxID=197152 RepID=UPI0032207242